MRHTETYRLFIVLGPPGWLILLCENYNGSIIYKAKLHNPNENIVKNPTNVTCQRAAYSDGLVYGFENCLVYLCVLEKKNSPNTDIKALSSKMKVTDALATLELFFERTVAECQRMLLKHQENILKYYEKANWNQSVIAFENFRKKVTEALAIVGSNHTYFK